jgi:hypothetical protein
VKNRRCPDAPGSNCRSNHQKGLDYDFYQQPFHARQADHPGTARPIVLALFAAQSNSYFALADASNQAMEKSETGERVLHSNVSQIRSLAKSVQEVNQVIEELEKRSGTISDVVDVIRKVADQTNLLALNAAMVQGHHQQRQPLDHYQPQAGRQHGVCQ